MLRQANSKKSRKASLSCRSAQPTVYKAPSMGSGGSALAIVSEDIDFGTQLVEFLRVYDNLHKPVHGCSVIWDRQTLQVRCQTTPSLLSVSLSQSPSHPCWGAICTTFSPKPGATNWRHQGTLHLREHSVRWCIDCWQHRGDSTVPVQGRGGTVPRRHRHCSLRTSSRLERARL